MVDVGVGGSGVGVSVGVKVGDAVGGGKVRVGSGTSVSMVSDERD